MLPAFYGGSEAAEGAQTVGVSLDAETEGIRISPVPGRVLRLGGQVTFQGVDSVHLYSDLGTRVTRCGRRRPLRVRCARSRPLRPDRRVPDGGQKLTGYATVWLKEDNDEVQLEGAPAPVIQFRCEDSEGKPLAPKSMSMMVSKSSPPDDSRAQQLSCGEAATASVGSWQIVISTPGRHLRCERVRPTQAARIERDFAAARRPDRNRGGRIGQTRFPEGYGDRAGWSAGDRKHGVSASGGCRSRAAPVPRWIHKDRPGWHVRA